jgi:hypothetical protein
MPELIRENHDTIVKGTLQQWWRVGPLQLTLEIRNEVDRFKRFDEEQCWIPYNRVLDGGGSYDRPEDDYPKFSALCRKHDIPFVIEHTDWSQTHFYIPSAHKMRFMEALEATIAAEGLARE